MASGSKNLKLADMTNGDLYELIDEIPSDQESAENEDSDDSDADFEQPQEDSLVVLSSEGESSDDDVPLSTYLPQPQDISQKITWSTENINKITPVQDFTGQHGLCSELLRKEDKLLTPYYFFNLFVSDKIIDDICFQTNLYAEQEYQKTNKRYTRTSVKEIKVFIGLNMLMGIKPMPSYRDYWSQSDDLRDHYISKFMPVNRFGWLLSHVHLNDNSMMPKKGEPNYNKLYKVRPFLDEIKNNFKKYYEPTRNIAIDESMIKYKGRSTLKQYMPKKPIKRGFKIWTLADQNGYLYNFDIYTGKSDDYVEHSLGEKVVLRLTEDLQQKNHTLFFDNYFNSYNLQKILKERGFYACGTVVSNRKHLPKLSDDKQLKQGQYEYLTSTDGITFFKWKDKRSVNILSNFHDPTLTSSVQRRQKDGSKMPVPCPTALIDYNMNMNFVDRFDQMKSTYELDRKSKKWWMRIFFHFLDCCMVNAYTLYKVKELKKVSLKDFRRKVIDGLLAERYVEVFADNPEESSEEPFKTRKRNVPGEVRFTSSDHQPVRSTRRRCARCSTKAHQIRTEWSCTICKVPLCLSKTRDCFQEYHRK